MGYFQLLVTKHQFFYRLIRGLTIKEHFIYLLDNRQLNIIFFRQFHGRFSGIHALYHHLYFLHGFLVGLALSDEDTGTTVAGMHAGAGHDQISDTGQTAEGLKITTHGSTKSCDFGNASGDQRSLRIISVAQSVCDTGSQCHYIFQCTAQFNAQYIRAGIDTEHFVHEQILHIFRAAFALRTRYDRCRNPAADFLRVGRSGQHRYLCLRNLIFDDLRLGHQGMLLDSLGDTDNFLSLCHQRADAMCCASGIGACHCHDQQVLALDGLFIIRRKDHILRKLYSRQHLVLMLLLKHLNLCGNRRPYRHLMSVLM